MVLFYTCFFILFLQIMSFLRIVFFLTQQLRTFMYDCNFCKTKCIKNWKLSKKNLLKNIQNMRRFTHLEIVLGLKLGA